MNSLKGFFVSKRIYSKGRCKSFLKNRKFHRIDGPAIINPDGSEEWFNEGVRHRLDGPAFSLTMENGSLYLIWYEKGVFHRKDGPAVIYPNGTEVWYKYGKVHREDGAAIIRPNGAKEYFLADVQFTYEQWFFLIPKKMKIKHLFSTC